MITLIQNDQTAPILPDEVEQSIKGKRILIIGSGADNDGRRMQEQIDSDYYHYVIRVNKHYGLAEDTGTRTDIIFTRWVQWVSNGSKFFTEDEIKNAKKIVVINQQVGIAQAEIEQGKIEVGHKSISAGIYAALWCINRGASQIDLIGYGKYSDGFRGKKYCQNSYNYPDRMTDNNPNYNWEKELAWMIALPEINLL